MFKHKNDIIIYTTADLNFLFAWLLFFPSVSSRPSTVKSLVAFVVVKSYLKHIQNNSTEKELDR